MFIDHFYFQFLLKQTVSLDPVQNAKWGGGGVHVLCPRNRSKWLANPELVPDFVTKTIMSLDNVYLHLVYCSFLFLNFFWGGKDPVHYRGSMGPVHRTGPRTRSKMGGPWPMTGIWEKEKLISDDELWMNDGELVQSTLYIGFTWPIGRFLTIQNVTRGH